MTLDEEASGRVRYRRCQRLDRRGVERVLTGGRSVHAGNFRMQFRRQEELVDGVVTPGRLGLIVAKRNAVRAVDRARVRRLVREAWRKAQARWQGMDCVVRLTRPFDRTADYRIELDRLMWCRR